MSANPRQLKRELRRHLLARHPDHNLATRLLTLFMNAQVLGHVHAEEHDFYGGRIGHQADDLRRWINGPKPRR